MTWLDEDNLSRRNEGLTLVSIEVLNFGGGVICERVLIGSTS